MPPSIQLGEVFFADLEKLFKQNSLSLPPNSLDNQNFWLALRQAAWQKCVVVKRKPYSLFSNKLDANNLVLFFALFHQF